MRLGSRSRTQLLGISLLAPAALVVTGVIIYPFANCLWLSTQSRDLVSSASRFVKLANYVRLVRTPSFRLAALNSVVWTVGSVALQIALGLAAALVLNKRFKLRALVRSALLIPYVMPMVVSCLIWDWMLNDMFGVVNRVLVGLKVLARPVPWLGQTSTAMLTLILINTWKHLPWVSLIMLAGLQSIPIELYEAASIDGAGRIQQFVHVTLPGLRSLLVIAVLLRSIWTFNNFDMIWLLTRGGPLNSTYTLPLVVYKTAFGLREAGLASAAAVMMFLVLVLFLVFYFRTYTSRDLV